MSTLGSAERPVRVAIVGAGPAGFFMADALLKRAAPVFEVDVFERLPTPFGLVRAGVAPDHQKIKGVTRTFDKTARHGRFRFLGNVLVGRDLTADELATHYDQVVYAVGSSTDRRLGIPGEELTGCHAATAFVSWYNAHPDFRDFPFDLNVERAVVVGVGNVAIDIARVLLRDRDELAKTDIASFALDALRASPLKEVVLLARRGAAQAAFTPVELEDIAHLASVGIRVDASQLQLDPAQFDALDSASKKNLELMRTLAAHPRAAPRPARSGSSSSPRRSSSSTTERATSAPCASSATSWRRAASWRAARARSSTSTRASSSAPSATSASRSQASPSTASAASSPTPTAG